MKKPAPVYLPVPSPDSQLHATHATYDAAGVAMYESARSLGRELKEYLFLPWGTCAVSWPAAATSVIDDFLIRTVAQVIDDLPEKERTVLALSHCERLTSKEIGDVLDLQESKVEKLHLQATIRIRAKLRRALITVP